MSNTTTPSRVQDDEGNTWRVTDSGCGGQVVHTEDGTSWEQVEPGEWWEPDTGRTARTVR